MFRKPTKIFLRSKNRSFHLTSCPRWRFSFSLLLYFSLIFLFLSIWNSNVFHRSTRRHFDESILNFQNDEIRCRAPELSIDSKEMWQFISPVNESKPKCSSTANWIRIVNNRIEVTSEARRLYRQIQCQAFPIVRPRGEEFYVTLGDAISFDQNQTPMIFNDFFQIDCQAENGENYSNFHLGIRRDFQVEQRRFSSSLKKTTNSMYNVLMFGFDSVSRLTFMRLLPKTYSYLINDLQSVVMKGYNIVGDGTTPNILALLTGRRIEELPEGRRGKDSLTDQMIHWFRQLDDRVKYCFWYRQNASFDLIETLTKISSPTLVRLRSDTKCDSVRDLIKTLYESHINDARNLSRIDLLNKLIEYKQHQHPQTKRRENLKMIDDFPWIWKQFVDHGYVTQWIEDWQGIGSLTWRLNGFYDPPVDHYGRPFYLWAERKRPSNFDHCFGSMSRFQSMLNYLNDLFLHYSSIEQKKFTFGFHKKYTHGSYDALPYADEELLDFLRMFHQRGEFNRTILILITDHGPRFFQTAQTSQGRLEERLPFLSIRMPEQFQHDYPERMKNLRLNSNRLTTPFDLHATFLHLFNIQSNETRSSSLFHLISTNRTCEQIGITSHLCACHQWKTISTNDSFIVRFSHEALSFFNRFLSIAKTQCAKLELIRLVKARQLTHHATYQIQFVTRPGDGLFELTADFHSTSNSFDIQRQQISRINRYGNASACIAEKYPEIREMCYCV